MSNPSSRVDTASRIIHAAPEEVYSAFIHPEKLMIWLPPEGMTGSIDAFDAREGGMYKMTLTYHDLDETTSGKSSDNTDVVQAEFLTIIPNHKIVQAIIFDSEDPAFAGKMIQTWLFEPFSEGTKVNIICENVPEGIRKEDHDEGLRSTLENLAEFMEDRPV
ncbi:SRPBCC domain-containing protein [Alkalicoccobacillus porphyridii]|uniref:ATPase n=1 Tax=Alkalicoccobacillus porphyridii TaxID=2597270 RepID=A0A554A2J3_9BACI|nr:SRPBCC domain-containing protein [Alkalicoccobacillus porphyridii]TSB47924.1 ATPase [Alkalicoccobacillus porphyridii]